jgi:hypothetical protein
MWFVHTSLICVYDAICNENEEADGQEDDTVPRQNDFQFVFSSLTTCMSQDAKSKITAIRASREVFNFQTVGRIPVASTMSVITLKIMTGYCILP